LLSCGGAQHAVDYRSVPLWREFHGFVNRCVFSCFEEQKLIKAEPQKIAKIRIDPGSAQATDPKIKQEQISQDAIKQFKSEAAIRNSKVRLCKKPRDNGIGKTSFPSPLTQGCQRNLASGKLRHISPGRTYPDFTPARPME
jgi:hypothetical protein